MDQCFESRGERGMSDKSDMVAIGIVGILVLSLGLGAYSIGRDNAIAGYKGEVVCERLFGTRYNLSFYDTTDAECYQKVGTGFNQYCKATVRCRVVD